MDEREKADVTNNTVENSKHKVNNSTPSLYPTVDYVNRTQP